MKKIPITQDQFDVIARLIRSRGPTMHAAYLVLIKGWRNSDAAIETAISPSRVSDAVRRFRLADAAVREVYGHRRQGSPQ